MSIEYAVEQERSLAESDNPARDFKPSSARTTLRAVIGPFWMSRLLVLVGGVFASVKVGTAGTAVTNFGSLLTAPSLHWDADWYLDVGRVGYSSPVARAFFPLYPLLMRVVGWTIGEVYAAVLISLVAFLVALFLLYRLVELDFGSEIAAATVALMAFCPMAVFFSAAYTESLFLALTVGAIYAARRERWLIAGIVGAFASATRNSGVLLVLPIALLYLYGPRGNINAPRSRWHDDRTGLRSLLPRYRLGWRVWPVILVPVGVVAFTVYLALEYHAGTSWLSAEKLWGHHTDTPIGGFVEGMEAGWSGLRDLISHPAGPLANSPDTTNLLNAIAAIAGVVVLLECIGKLPVAYWVYAVFAFLVPLASPLAGYPLNSFPRYELVIFPLFICVARYVVRKRWTMMAVAGSAVLLGTFGAMIAVGPWIA